ncbi:hypothetical protein [Tardiphaga sp.]|uniref:hypothetical protein n=1 Tax=Tardiphaga sp. TaxID=1926292 RepID=UPI0025DC539C|nr:hypothetical protein [Tardiphaga sp.]
MTSKTRSAPRKKKTAAEPARTTSTIAVAARNLLNMAVVMASSGTVLLTLMVVKEF